jgi:hypothetical protein
MLGKSSPTRPNRGGSSSGGGMPAWLVFILGVAIVFGMYYLWLGVRDYSGSVGLSGLATREAATQTAIAEGANIVSGANVGSSAQVSSGTLTGNTNPVEPRSVEPSPAMTLTPIPECQDFVIVERANIRNAPNTQAGVIEVYQAGQTICVIGVALEDSDWYLIDVNPISRRVDAGYVYYTLARAINPTPRPTHTPTPLPTVTPMPTQTPSITPTPQPTNTPDLDATPTSTLTPTSTPTVSYQSA